MSITMDDSIKRWMAKRKTALVIEIIQGKTTVAEASRSFDLTPSEIEGWVEDAKRGMENSLRTNPLDIREQYEKQLKDLQEAYGECMLEIRVRKKLRPSWSGRSDNGSVFTSRHFTALVRSYGLKQEFITPHCPQQNGMIERVIRTLKEQCVHRHRFESIQHATRVIADWISFYNNRRPHQALAMRTPAKAFRLAA